MSSSTLTIRSVLPATTGDKLRRFSSAGGQRSPPPCSTGTGNTCLPPIAPLIAILSNRRRFQRGTRKARRSSAQPGAALTQPTPRTRAPARCTPPPPPPRPAPRGSEPQREVSRRTPPAGTYRWGHRTPPLPALKTRGTATEAR